MAASLTSVGSNPMVWLIVLASFIFLIFYTFGLKKNLAKQESTAKNLRESEYKLKNENDKIRSESKKKSEELESLQKNLNETKSKLKRAREDVHDSKTKKSGTPGQPTIIQSSDSSIGVVTLSNQELEESYTKRLDELRAQLEEKDRSLKLARQELEKQKVEQERARTEALASAGVTTAEQNTKPLESQITELQNIIAELRISENKTREKAAQEIRRTDKKAEAANRRAANNLVLYNVLKGQLEILEDKLANYRRKYEGAKDPSQMKSADLAPDNHEEISSSTQSAQA